jgi:hypothetical protein
MANFNLGGAVDPSNPTQVMATPAISSGSTMMFPSDISNMPYYTSLRFVKYSRPFAGSTASEKETGTIILPIPQNFIDAQSVRYNGTEMGNLGALGLSAAFGDFNEAQKAGQSFSNALGDSDGKVAKIKTALGAMASIIPKEMSDSTFGRIVAAGTGVVPNPHLALLFDGVNLRSHSLQWRFSPKNEAEAKTLGQLLYFMKRKMLPSYNATVSKFALDFPDQVYVDFKNVDTQFKDSIKKSMILDVQVDGAPEGVSFYKSGVPTVVELRLDLTETEIRTQEDYTAT